MADITIKAEFREAKSTKKSLHGMRGDRKIPGVVYGGKGKSVAVAVLVKDLLGAIESGGANAIIRLKLDKSEDTVIVKELQRHVVTSQPLHVDFQRIDLAKKITVKVPIHVIGEAPGVKFHGGVLEHILREIEVQALPGSIPQRIDLDVSRLDVGEGIHVREIKVPAGVDVIEGADKIVLHIVHATVEEAPAPAEGAQAAEPEVIIAKGKKDEEGAPVAAAKGEGGAKEKEPEKKKEGEKKK